MEKFLLAVKQSISELNHWKKVTVIMGNESCDLDSAICTLIHGYWYYNINEHPVVPVLNVSKQDFKLKTEVNFVLEKEGIHPELLIFRDEIDLKNLYKRNILELILVDHHTLNSCDMSYTDSVVEVIDHRPQDPNWLWKAPNINCILEKVGSCASLIARNILEKNPELIDQSISNLLIGPILIDTCNFSKIANRVTPLDIEMVNKLQDYLEINSNRDEYNTKIYNEILKAKTDVSGLKPGEILLKDLKLVNGIIPMPGLPILVKEFLNLNGALEAVNSFTRERGCSLTVLLGMNLTGDVVNRDLAIFSFSPNDLENKIVEKLYNEKDKLGVSLIWSKSDEERGWSIKLFKQENVQATRKQILPIVQSAVCIEH